MVITIVVYQLNNAVMVHAMLHHMSVAQVDYAILIKYVPGCCNSGHTCNNDGTGSCTSSSHNQCFSGLDSIRLKSGEVDEILSATKDLQFVLSLLFASLFFSFYLTV